MEVWLPYNQRSINQSAEVLNLWYIRISHGGDFLKSTDA